MDTSRRDFLKYGLAGTTLSVAAARSGPARAEAAASGAAGAGRPARLRPFLEPLPVPGAGIVVATPAAPDAYRYALRQIRRRLHPQLPKTPVWAYDGSGLGGQAGSFGMAIAAQTGTPVQVSYTHRLPVSYPSWIPVDTRLTPGAARCG